MPKRKRHKKGTVVVGERNGMLGLRWRVNGKQYRLALGLSDTPKNRKIALGRAGAIQADIAFNQFDTSLQKYRPSPEKPHLSMPTIFDEFIQFRRDSGTSEQTLSNKYRSLRSNLERFGPIDGTAKAMEFVEYLRSRQSPKIANQNLTLLQSFSAWAFKAKLTDADWFKDINPLRVSKEITKRKPFTIEEIKRFLVAIAKHPKYSNYHDVCLTLFSLGLRPSELIGLRWQHVSFDNREIIIKESLVRRARGTPGATRIRKGTKTGAIRTLPLSDRLLEMLKSRWTNQEPEQLIFTDHRGKPIDDANIRIAWKAVCEAAEIPYRPPYTARHTLISLGIEQGWTLPQAAQIAGHTSTQMVMNVYGHAMSRPELPTFE